MLSSAQHLRCIILIFFSLQTVTWCLKTFCLQGMMGLITQTIAHAGTKMQKHRSTHNQICLTVKILVYTYSVKLHTFCQVLILTHG